MSASPESQASQELRGVLLPLQEGQLLLPNAAVCEVVSYRAPDPIHGDKPDWVLGSFSWRNHALPLISYERLLQQDSGEVGHRARVAICNTLNQDELIPYIGILLDSAPHLARVTEEAIAPLPDDASEGLMVLARVTINGVEALIPDLDALEAALSGLK